MQGRQGYRDAAPCKSTRKRKPGNNANAHGSALPPESFHIHAPVGFELDAFPFQQVLLFGPIGGGAAGVVDYAVAGVAAVQLGMAEDVAYQPRIVVAADQAGNLTVAGHLAAGYLPYGGQNLVNQVLVQYFAHGVIPFLSIGYPLRAAVSMRQFIHGAEIAAALHQLGKGAGLGDAAVF